MTIETNSIETLLQYLCICLEKIVNCYPLLEKQEKALNNIHKRSLLIKICAKIIIRNDLLVISTLVINSHLYTGP